MKVIAEFPMNDMEFVEDTSNDNLMYGSIRIGLDGRNNKSTIVPIIGTPYRSGTEYTNSAHIYCSLNDVESIIKAFRIKLKFIKI